MGVECPKCKTENTSDSEFCKKCATPLPSSKEIPASPTETLETPKEELTTGSTFAGRYQIIEELGKGGMGKVYKAHDTEIKEKIALKLIKPEISADKRTIERFQNELKFARKISHRNVCRMYDLNKEEGSYYITMEYVSGEDLKSMIGMMGQLSGGKAISVARQVCEGLTEAHRLGVVHRDLKPQNIMIDREGNARIMDFGIARSLKAKGITGAGVMVGTPEYMSPEQAEVKEVDQRSDIYSLGVILYEMVTGRVPFEGETPLGVAMKHKSEMPKDPRELNSQTPEDLSRVILRCMEKDKEKRYQSGGELRAELENIEKGIPTTERVIPKRKPITSKEITVTFSPKKLLIPALVVVALVVAVVVILQLLPKKETMHIAPTDKPSLAVMYFENNTGDENLDHWRKMLSDLLITDLAQSKHLRVLPGDRLFKILNKLNQLEAKTFSSDVLKEVASQGGVKYVLVGKYAKMEDTFRIDIMIQDVNTGELVSTLRTEARGQKDVFAKVDELTQKIKTNFNLSQEQIDGDFDYEVGKITTGSPEAFRYFSQAIKIRVSGKEQECLPLLERAISIDPEFALAYREMGMVYWNLGYRDEAEKHLQTAFELSDRLSDRDRFQIQGSFYGSSEKTYDKAIEAYNNLLKLYPDDHLSNHNLGLLYQWIDEWNKAAEQYEFLIKNGSEFAYSHANLASVYENMGYFEKAVKVYEYYLNNISDNAYIRRALAFNYRVQGKFDLALQEMDKALLLEPTHYMNPWVTGNVYL
jgi:serine/threonine protein kinase/tetratricopeptide (TPR) repeat protein